MQLYRVCSNSQDILDSTQLVQLRQSLWRLHRKYMISLIMEGRYGSLDDLGVT